MLLSALEMRQFVYLQGLFFLVSIRLIVLRTDSSHDCCAQAPDRLRNTRFLSINRCALDQFDCATA
jgi:hypothetical protein